MIQQILLILEILTCVAILALVLIQHGKGADIGAAFGSGASNTVFGSQGSGSFLMKITYGLATLFFLITLALAYLASAQYKASQQVTHEIVPKTAVTQPVQRKTVQMNTNKQDKQAEQNKVNKTTTGN